MPGDSAGMSAAADYQQKVMHAGITQHFVQKAFAPLALPVAGRHPPPFARDPLRAPPPEILSGDESPSLLARGRAVGALKKAAVGD
jgi:hypothetical protein